MVVGIDNMRRIIILLLAGITTVLILVVLVGFSLYQEQKTGQVLIPGVMTYCVSRNTSYAARQVVLHGRTDVQLVSGIITHKQENGTKTEPHVWTMVSGVLHDEAFFAVDKPVYQAVYSITLKEKITFPLSLQKYQADNGLGFLNVALDYFAARGAIAKQVSLRDRIEYANR